MSVLRLLCWFGLAAVGFAQRDPRLPACPEGPLYSVIPMELDEFLAFRPLGFVGLPSNAFPVKHSSFSIALPGTATPERAVVFPGDLWVTEIWSYRSANYGGYQVYFQPCAEVRGYFFHLKDIAQSLKTLFDAAPQSCQDFADPSGNIVKCRALVSVRVAAGDPMGISGDGAGVDFGMADFRVEPRGLVNLEHYPYDYPYYVSPIAYYPAEVRERFSSKLASWDGSTFRTAEPRVGEYRPDIPGTAQGLWFVPGRDMRTNSSDMTPNLALVNDYIDSDQPTLMLGTSLKGVKLSLYTYTPSAVGQVNRRARDIRPDGGIYCIEGFPSGRTSGRMPTERLDGVLLLTLPTETTLRAEVQFGRTCDGARPWSFTENAVLYER
jgi:hypothetical protein